jgi:hypothetical protein
MGGAAVIDAASQLDGLTCVVAWVPDPNVESFEWPKNGIIEEGGQAVKASYWQEAYDEKIADKLIKVGAPAYCLLSNALMMNMFQ